MSSQSPTSAQAPLSFKRMGIVGTGAMGRGIAQIAAEAGLEVKLFDQNPDATEAAIDFVAGLWEKKVSKNKLTENDQTRLLASLIPGSDLADLADCDVIVEAIVEKVEVKQRLFVELENLISENAILATNTSSLSVTDIASGCARPEQIIGFHFFNPVPLMKIVEVIPGVKTAPAVVERMTQLGQQLGHFTALTTDTPGFLVNHAGRAFGTEALRILTEGTASCADIDRIMTDQGGFKMGPFTLMDLTGLDVSSAVMESIYHQYYQEPRYRPAQLIQTRVSAGLLGRKTKAGFYEYRDGQQIMPEESPVERTAPCPVWISPEDEASHAVLTELVESANWPLASSADEPNALCLVTPWGEDIAGCALRQGLPPARTLGIDMLAGLEKRRSIMTSPATETDFIKAALTLFSEDGTAVTRLKDSQGFVLQRIIACIVNIGCDIAQQGIAKPDTINRAVELGLGYPKGPLALGDHYGPARILEILNNLQSTSGDPRYRPSPWLRRRALLGLPLTAEEL
ncbi:MAG: 3-hydroxyacyl-CoA dehydrogenase [Saccharospirillum sp.]|uniref:3-hydroxyacyl-CoA dehydrogenase n=1 Tax=Saccharospirillum sp. TaxID=2033801 RepID=UPI0034A020EC